MRRAIVGVIILAGAVGCDPELGPCEPTTAISVAYDPASGAPAYEGQALMIRSCGNGAFCHAQDAPLADRFGVPEGLTFDVRLASSDGLPNEEEVARLRRGRFRVVQTAQLILHTLDVNSMPITRGVGAEVAESEPTYVTLIDGEFEPLPAIDSSEGREVLRNWLACGAPVVERPLPRADGVNAVVVPSFPVEPLTPTWTSVYEDLLTARGCGTASCHGGTRAGFRVTDSEETYAALVRATSSGAETATADDPCPASAVLIEPEAPDESLFVLKLSARAREEVCGDPMPRGGFALSPEDLDAIRTWILAGAPMD